MLRVYILRMRYSTLAKRAYELRRALETMDLDALTVRTLDADGPSGDAVRSLVALSRALSRFARDNVVAADEWRAGRDPYQEFDK